MNEDSNYSTVKGKTAEELLAVPGVSDGAALGGYLRVASSVRSIQELVGAHEDLIGGLNKASADGSRLQRKIIYLTMVLATVGALQFAATAWPHIFSKPHITASELFDLQTKCGKIGVAAIAQEKESHFDNGRNTAQIEYSIHYNQTTNHCYLDESGYLSNLEIKGILYFRTVLDAQYGSRILACSQLLPDASGGNRQLIACQGKGERISPPDAKNKMDTLTEAPGGWPFH